ncbi:MAG: LytTR family DNA-binding domain-containing protein [Anaerovoracaceae bacterium]|nr:LytTR family transcriptional regulator [Bacillota bacterium]MDY3954649.1 LytTR family DNA-binding domain-containing protein [Anaerovoracaceae bacterium]
MNALKYCTKRRKIGEKIPLCIQKGIYQIRVSEIDFLESEQRKVHIHLENGEVLTAYGKISEMQAMLDDCFCRCSQAVLVNMRNVRSLVHMKFKFLSGNEAEISQRYYADVRRRFCRYINSELSGEISDE